MERTICLGENCPDKRCEICNAARTLLDTTDSYRSHPSISPSGYYSSGGIVRVLNKKTGKIELHYARNAGD